ncbi:cation diffusion facilitator family transporter [Methanobacterium sp.]|uniref:cation diffusion facilitator family transporter n=1 Tax=Methanobacterium sp. TaxID=2164 RepID=UPI0025EF1FA3|nr:cation diffusion facilitator family transporter [Methanobacterium sp.]MBI5459003.1 cation transporter [Methanobacterium sp.]
MSNHELNNQQDPKGHGHTHGAVDPSIITTERGIWAVKWSFIGLLPTALIQLFIVLFTGSVALFADSIHNFGDAATAIPLWVAFILARRASNKRFSYGYGRVEDLAGVLIVVIILLSAILAGYESINRFFHPQIIDYLWAVMLAAIVGFVGNEIVAQFRIKIGKEIGSAALIADGNHARVDGFTSLAVLFGAIGVWLGFPLADPIIGLIITIVIFKVVWDSVKSVFTRLLDGVDPEVIDEIEHTISHIESVQDIGEVRVRWLGHRLHAEVNIAVDPKLTVEEGHEIAKEVRHQLLHHLQYLSNATIHIDPVTASGEKYHSISNHEHGDLPSHSHK